LCQRHCSMFVSACVCFSLMAILNALVEVEQGLPRQVFSWLNAVDSACCSMVCKWAFAAASDASKENVQLIIRRSGILLSRWRHSKYSGAPFREHSDIETAAQHFPRISGRYCFGIYCTLDIEPDGSFQNYGETHSMVGQATIAGVVYKSQIDESSFSVPPGLEVCSMCELDRWYTKAETDGRERTVEELEFVGPGYQTYSVHAWMEPTDFYSPSKGAFMSNRPRPTPAEGCALQENPFQTPWARDMTWHELESWRKFEADSTDSSICI